MAAIRRLRHATLLLEVDDTTVLVDAMLSESGDVPPIPNSPNDRENPLVEPVELPDVALNYDAVLVTHRRRDHFDGSRTIYLAGDAVWYDTVPKAIDTHDPDAVVVNAGATQSVEGEPTTMTPEAVGSVREAVADGVPVVADHMDAISYCLATWKDLAATVDGVAIPDDGERIEL
ncbi:MBL fold metallo-hydrolase [Halorientalis sp.]|uniref:MBL fold metallo-hydrolase n=1 Tax=Halorientalis sp. TaxID=1931229 RepID=UPI00262ECDE7|nr:hypothetical protein [Halorientalis sp.]